MEPQPQGEPSERAPVTVCEQLASLRRVANPYLSSMLACDRIVLKRVMLDAGFEPERVESEIRDRARAQARAEQLIVWLGGIPPLKSVEHLVEVGLEVLPGDLRQKESVRHMLEAVAAMIETATGGI